MPYTTSTSKYNLEELEFWFHFAIHCLSKILELNYKPISIPCLQLKLWGPDMHSMCFLYKVLASFCHVFSLLSIANECLLAQPECSSQHMVLHLMNIQTISLSKSSYPINLRRSTEKCKIQRSSNLLLKSLIRSAERLWFHQMQSVIVSNCLCNPHVFHVS